MGKFFWVMMAILGGVLIVLIVNHDHGSTLGIENEKLASAAFGSMWIALIASAVFQRERRFGDILKQLAIWLGIFVALTAVYVFRFDIQDIGSRLSGGLIPGSPISTFDAQGRKTVTLIRTTNGHFEADGLINQHPSRFLVDTGATSVVLTYSDALNSGIDKNALNFSILTRTANGTGRAAMAQIGSIKIGAIERRNLKVLVAEPGRLQSNLLGQEFLESLAGYQRSGDRLTLFD